MTNKIRPISRSQEIFNREVKKRMAERYKAEPNESRQLAALASASGVSVSTLQRIVKPETYGFHSTSLEIVEALAAALRCEVSDLVNEIDRPTD